MPETLTIRLDWVSDDALLAFYRRACHECDQQAAERLNALLQARLMRLVAEARLWQAQQQAAAQHWGG